MPPKPVNENRIVRVRSDKLHNMLTHVARLTKVPYQKCFEVFIDMIMSGYIVGDVTHLVLMEKVLRVENGD